MFHYTPSVVDIYRLHISTHASQKNSTTFIYHAVATCASNKYTSQMPYICHYELVHVNIYVTSIEIGMWNSCSGSCMAGKGKEVGDISGCIGELA